MDSTANLLALSLFLKFILTSFLFVSGGLTIWAIITKIKFKPLTKLYESMLYERNLAAGIFLGLVAAAMILGVAIVIS